MKEQCQEILSPHFVFLVNTRVCVKTFMNLSKTIPEQWARAETSFSGAESASQPKLKQVEIPTAAAFLQLPSRDSEQW
jgi:hypothetical protein